jgi:hypothetical protein
MAYQPTDSELEAFGLAHDSTSTPVIVAPGPLPSSRRTSIEGAWRGVLYWVNMQGVPRIAVEDDEEVVMEITAARVASVRMVARPLSADATVEVYARKEIDDGERQCFVISGRKRDLKRAFAFIGHALS